jgi:hypothetical protein
MADNKTTRSRRRKKVPTSYRKTIPGWRTYDSVAGKVVKEIEISNDECPAVTIYFQDGTQFHVRVRHTVEFRAQVQELKDDDLIVLENFPVFKEVKR